MKFSEFLLTRFGPTFSVDTESSEWPLAQSYRPKLIPAP